MKREILSSKVFAVFSPLLEIFLPLYFSVCLLTFTYRRLMCSPEGTGKVGNSGLTLLGPAATKNLKEENEGQCLHKDCLIAFAYTGSLTEIRGSKTHFLFVYLFIDLYLKLSW